MSEHTPLPWTDDEGEGWIRSTAVGTAGSRIGQCLRNAEANAEFIVRACNSHDDLLAALEAAFIQKDGDVFYRTRNNIPQDVPERIARKVHTAFKNTQTGQGIRPASSD